MTDVDEDNVMAGDESAGDVEETLDEGVDGDSSGLMADRSPDTAPETVGLGGLDVEIQFVVGTAQVSLSELRRLDEGSVIENAVNRFYPRVVAQVNGRGIAEGEFLDVDGQVGFRVTKILI